jgi:hypothetical protein
MNQSKEYDPTHMNSGNINNQSNEYDPSLMNINTISPPPQLNTNITHPDNVLTHPDNETSES